MRSGHSSGPCRTSYYPFHKKAGMYYDPANPFENTDPAYTGGTDGTTDSGEAQPDEENFDPGGDGYWQLINGVWKWLTDPLGRTATTGS